MAHPYWSVHYNFWKTKIKVSVQVDSRLYFYCMHYYIMLFREKEKKYMKFGIQTLEILYLRPYPSVHHQGTCPIDPHLPWSERHSSQ